MPNTVRFQRVLRAAPEKVYRAFLDAGAMAKWLPPNGFTGKVYHVEYRARRAPGCHFTRGLLSRLARIADPFGETRRG